MIVTSDLCFRAALNPLSVSVKELKEIAAKALNAVWEEEKNQKTTINQEE